MHKKIVFPLEQDDDGYPPVNYERLWAEELPEGGFKVDNIPFFSREVALGDCIEATEEEGELRFERLVEESENSLIRVVYFDGTDPREIRRELDQLGCKTELDQDHTLIAVNVPKDVSLAAVQAFLATGGERWDYEEAILRQ